MKMTLSLNFNTYFQRNKTFYLIIVLILIYSSYFDFISFFVRPYLHVALVNPRDLLCLAVCLD